MSRKFKGKVAARIVSVRFAIAGKLVSINKHIGDVVKKGEILASLDTKILQAGLDKQLADYEKIRADFEIFAQKYPDPQDTIDKYLKTEKQASLNSSVKDVELAKAVLDQTTVFSPVEGLIINDSDLVPGIYVTPSGSEIKIADASSYYFLCGIEQKDIPYFEKTKEVKIKIEGVSEEIKGNPLPVQSDGKSFFVKIPITYSQNILIGQNGEAKF